MFKLLFSLLHFEHKYAPLVSFRVFFNRMTRNVLAGFIIMFFFLGLGVIGYHNTCGIGWLDSLLNASMILSGMGPILTEEIPDAGKWFASVYALVSGVVFITTIGIIIAPVAHRVFHKFHLEEENESATQ